MTEQQIREQTVAQCAAIVAHHAARYHNEHALQEPMMTMIRMEQDILALVAPRKNTAGLDYPTAEELAQSTT